MVSATGGVCSDEDLKKNCPSGSYWNGYMGVCEPVDKPCPEGQKKKDGQCVPDGECPEGMVATPGTTPGAIQQGSLYCSPEKSECPAGNVKSAAGKCLPGDGQCSAGEAKGKDGTCKKDSNGDGKPDEEDGEQDPNKDSASGGDSCDAPPSCSGNAIQCMQVKVQWRIDCNTRKNRNVTGGTCTAVPICTGDKCDAMEYASLLQQWKSACALEKLAKDGTGEGAGDSSDANGNGVPDVLEGTGEVTGPGDGTGDVEGAKKFGLGVSTNMLDQDNIFGGGSCPQPPTFQLMGVTISGADFPYWCKAMSILRALILLFGAFTALKILMGWGF
ncbi:virulence factor TspB C-terminal domain-related protein [Stenotrophomonas terrae]|uniref:virulence factor TspB C-terminal domain-related protein n=1 Tax=Stenotrophomonas terrae TaxID=405446 RepID=UPI00128F47EA|nr:virulence factor TspB C-terminal domain-related protein [Stenotrophomonas terrae]